MVCVAGGFKIRQVEVELTANGQHIDHMKAFSRTHVLQGLMPNPDHAAHLTALRDKRGLSVRELARMLDVAHSNVLFWERTGSMPRAEMLPKLAEALGVSVEEVLGQAKPKRVLNPGGKMRTLFEQASQLPRSDQQKVIALLEAFVGQRAKAS